MRELREYPTMLHFRASEEEARRYEEAAEREGLSLSAWLRKVAEAAAK